jgi:hypothetical protein
MDTLYCMSCGTCNGEYTVIKHSRICRLCRDGVILSVNEVIDLYNEFVSQGLIKEDMLDYISDEQYQRCELDFDNDLLSVEEALAREDAMRDMYDMDEEH